MRQFILCLILMGVLVGCGGKSDTAGELAPIASPDVEVENIRQNLVDCDTYDLENWLEIILPKIQAIRAESSEMVTLPLEELPMALERLTELMTVLDQTPPLDCALWIMERLNLWMEGVRVTFADYYAREVEPEAFLSEISHLHQQYDEMIYPLLDKVFIILVERLGDT